MLLKKRQAKVSQRGIYLQDKILQETMFQPGSHIKYVIDQKSKKIIILGSDMETNNTVSQRRLKKSVKPVIDIRGKAALSAFEGCDYLQVEIFGDSIVVQGFINKPASTIQKVARAANKLLGQNRKIFDISDILSVKKKAEIVLSRKGLQKAAGLLGYEQLELDLFLGEDAGISDSSKAFIKPALANLEIPLQVASLFSGAGIFDLGFIESGFDVVFALEIDEDAAKTYRYNIGPHIINGDITKINKSTIPNAPVMIGGSPCQGFSNSNRYTNFLDNPNNFLVNFH
jgi:DNA (cytosine-5)-methyltransferase 1